MGVKDYEIKETGLYQSARTITRGSIYILVLAVSLTVLSLLLYFVILTSGTADVDGKTVYSVKSFYVLMTAIPVFFTITCLFVVSGSNLYFAKRSRTEGPLSTRREEVLISNADPPGSVKYMVIINSECKCSACGAGSIPENAKFCPQCGQKQ
jgi:hypothetical protein